MASLESNELIEGDFMYLPYFTYIKDEIDVSSDESATAEVDNYSDTEISEFTKQQFPNVKDPIKVDTSEEISTESDYYADSNDSTSYCTNASGKLSSNEESCFSFEQAFENHSINQNTSKKSLKKKRFSTLDLIDMYCCDCKKVRKRVWGDKRTVCKKCKVSLKYQCTKCKKRYKTYKKAFLHIKTKCNQTPLFQCSACNYEARNKVKLNDHVQNRHTLQECSGCGERYESNRMVKHQLFDCKSWNNPLNNDTCSKTKEFNANEIDSINQKPQVIKPGLLLERYCKTCDETIEKVRGVNTCKDCKSSLLYQCIICCNRYSKIISAYQHIRSCIQLSEFHCSECGFQTVYKTSLVNHIESKHVLQECEACDVICKNRRSLLKHKKYDCKDNQRVKSSKSKRNKTSP